MRRLPCTACHILLTLTPLSLHFLPTLSPRTRTRTRPRTRPRTRQRTLQLRTLRTRTGCPYSRYVPFDLDIGTGAPDPHSSFFNLKTNQKVTRSKFGSIQDEFVSRVKNMPGTLAMANQGKPNTAGSQFFLNMADNSFLDWWDTHNQFAAESRHAVFAKVIEGLDVAVAISKAPVRIPGEDIPRVPIEMLSVSIEGIDAPKEKKSTNKYRRGCEEDDLRRRRLEGGTLAGWRERFECWLESSAPPSSMVGDDEMVGDNEMVGDGEAQVARASEHGKSAWTLLSATATVAAVGMPLGMLLVVMSSRSHRSHLMRSRRRAAALK